MQPVMFLTVDGTEVRIRPQHVAVVVSKHPDKPLTTIVLVSDLIYTVPETLHQVESKLNSQYEGLYYIGDMLERIESILRDRS